MTVSLVEVVLSLWFSIILSYGCAWRERSVMRSLYSGYFRCRDGVWRSECAVLWAFYYVLFFNGMFGNYACGWIKLIMLRLVGFMCLAIVASVF